MPSKNGNIIKKMIKMIDKLTVPMARASILWLIGEYSDKVSKQAPDVLRKMAKTFCEEENVVKLQILNLAAKLYVTNQKQVALLVQYVLNLAKYDQNYDIRDRGRFMRALIFNNEKCPVLAKHLKKIILVSKPAPVLQSIYKDSDQYQLGTLSHAISSRVNGYTELPDFPLEAPDPTVRNIEIPVEVAKTSERRNVAAGGAGGGGGGATTKSSRNASKRTEKFYSDEEDDDDDDEEKSQSTEGADPTNDEEEEEEEEQEEDNDEENEETEEGSSENESGSESEKSDASGVNKKKSKKNGRVSNSDKSEASSSSEEEEEDSESSSENESDREKVTKKQVAPVTKSNVVRKEKKPVSSESSSSSSSESESSESEAEVKEKPPSKATAQSQSAKPVSSRSKVETKAESSVKAGPSKKEAKKEVSLLDLDFSEPLSTGPAMPTLASNSEMRPSSILSPSLAADLAHLSSSSSMTNFNHHHQQSHMSKKEYELINKIFGNGLQIQYRFTRTPHPTSNKMITVELTCTNVSNGDFVSVSVTNRKLQMGMSMSDLPEFDLIKGASVCKTLGIDFNDTLQSAQFEITAVYSNDPLLGGTSTSKKWPNLSIACPIGELVQPGWSISENEFNKLQAKLKGMNEISGTIEELTHALFISKNLSAKLLENVNMCQIPSSQQDTIKFGALTFATKTPLLLSLYFANNSKKCQVNVNCEKIVLANMFLKEIKQLIS